MIGPITALLTILAAIGLILKLAYDVGKHRGKAEGYIEASEYFREQEAYMHEMTDGYCEHLARQYDQMVEELSERRRIH